jgi:ABC-type antimicrobial peptide transport system permease subunit
MDPYTVLDSMILVSVGALAVLFPVRRIVSVDPAQALRAE